MTGLELFFLISSQYFFLGPRLHVKGHKRTELRRLLTASEMKAAKTDKTVNVKSVNVYTTLLLNDSFHLVLPHLHRYTVNILTDIGDLLKNRHSEVN